MKIQVITALCSTWKMAQIKIHFRLKFLQDLSLSAIKIKDWVRKLQAYIMTLGPAWPFYACHGSGNGLGNPPSLSLETPGQHHSFCRTEK